MEAIFIETIIECNIGYASKLTYSSILNRLIYLVHSICITNRPQKLKVTQNVNYYCNFSLPFTAFHPLSARTFTLHL